MKKIILGMTVLSILAGCDALQDLGAVPKAKAANNGSQSATPTSRHNCVTTGSNSPIVVGANSVVVIDGKEYPAGQNADCEPAGQRIETHGANSPIVTGAGAKVIIKTDR